MTTLPNKSRREIKSARREVKERFWNDAYVASERSRRDYPVELASTKLGTKLNRGRCLTLGTFAKGKLLLQHSNGAQEFTR